MFKLREFKTMKLIELSHIVRECMYEFTKSSQEVAWQFYFWMKRVYCTSSGDSFYTLNLNIPFNVSFTSKLILSKCMAAVKKDVLTLGVFNWHSFRKYGIYKERSLNSPKSFSVKSCIRKYDVYLFNIAFAPQGCAKMVLSKTFHRTQF